MRIDENLVRVVKRANKHGANPWSRGILTEDDRAAARAKPHREPVSAIGVAGAVAEFAGGNVHRLCGYLHTRGKRAGCQPLALPTVAGVLNERLTGYLVAKLPTLAAASGG